MHSWSPRFRVTNPGGGNPVVVDPTAWTAPTGTVMTVLRPRPVPTSLEHETLGLGMRTTRRAVQMYVDMVFEFDSGSADEAALVNGVLNPHMQDDAKVELSLDGGTTYREVVLSDESPQPEPTIEGKNIGTVYAMTWVTTEALDRFIVLGAGGWA